MDLLLLLSAGGLILFVGFAVIRAFSTSPPAWLGFAAAAIAFLAYSLIPVAREGPVGFVAQHLQDWWGVQIWLDLLCAFAIGWTFFVPRARAAGMNPWPWLAAILLSGSIGFLAAVARLLWLEGRERGER